MDNLENKKYEYDLVFSVAGEDKEFAQVVKDILKKQDVKSWIYTENEHELLGRDMNIAFQNLFVNKAKHAVVIVSKFHVQKPWTTEERQFILDRFRKDPEYLLPISIDGNRLPGISDSIGYLDVKGRNASEVAQIIYKRIMNVDSAENKEYSFKLPQRIKKFNPLQTKDEWLEFIKHELTTRCKASDLYIHIEEGNTLKIRIMYADQYIYSLNILKNAYGEDNGLTFYGITGEIRGFVSDSTSNASGKFEYSNEKGTVVLNILNFSLFNNIGEKSLYTREEFVNEIWNLIIKKLEE